MNQPIDSQEPSLQSYQLNWRQATVAKLIYLFFKLMHSTYRYRYFGIEHRDRAVANHDHGCFTLALWHEHLFASLGAHSDQRVAPIISHSRDGEIVARIAARMQLFPVRGSSSKGGRQAKSDIESMIDDGYNAAITLDGPRGPRRESKLGVFAISKKTGCSILPSVAVAPKVIRLKSWDRFQIPLPFSRIAVAYHQPIAVDDSASSKSAFVLLKQQLHAAIDSIDHLHYFDNWKTWKSGLARKYLLTRYRYSEGRNCATESYSNEQPMANL